QQTTGVAPRRRSLQLRSRNVAARQASQARPAASPGRCEQGCIRFRDASRPRTRAVPCPARRCSTRRPVNPVGICILPLQTAPSPDGLARPAVPRPRIRPVAWGGSWRVLRLEGLEIFDEIAPLGGAAPGPEVVAGIAVAPPARVEAQQAG